MTIHLWKPGQELKAGTEADTMREHCLVACSPWLLLLVCSYTIQPFLPRNVIVCTGLSPPTSILTQENILQTRSQANLMKAIPHLRLFSQVPLGCIELRKINQHNCCFTDGETEAQGHKVRQGCLMLQELTSHGVLEC